MKTSGAVAVIGAAAVFLAGAAPNDPLYTSGGPLGQWNLMGTVHPSFPEAGVRGIDAEGAWDLTMGRRDVVIAVLDSGVKMDHADLAANIDLNEGECAAIGVVDSSGDGVLTVAEAGLAFGDIDGDQLITALDALEGCSNGADDDANGYVDDIAGWDFQDDDNLPSDEHGHGTGRAGIAAAVANDSWGMAGVCPGCTILPVRLGRTFVATPDKLAEAIAYAADRGASAAVMATGSLGNSAALRAAVDYADESGVVLCAAIGNERSRHHHFPQSYENVIAVAGVTYDEPDAPVDFAGRWLGTNFGAHATLAAPTFVWATTLDGAWEEHGGTSSSAPHCGGVAGLVTSRARDLGIALTARQARSILVNTADDAPSWSPYAGAGRLDALAAVTAVDSALLPPDARIVSPKWWRHHAPGEITVEIAADPAAVVTLEMGYGAAPQTWQPIGAAFTPSVPPPPKPMEDELGDAFAVTVRMTATAASGATTVDRRTFFVQADPSARTGFPVQLGSSAEGAPALADLDGDNRLETIVATNDGRVHALRHDGTPLAGWPVLLGAPRALHPTAAAHASGAVPSCCSSLFSGVAAGDLDGDGRPEVITAALDGRLYAWTGAGVAIAGLTRDLDAPVWASPVLADLDADGALDVIVATASRQVHAFRADGAAITGWPVDATDPLATGVLGGVVATPAAGDLDGDGAIDVVVATTEAAQDGLFSRGRVYAFRANGTPFSGFPVQPFGLMKETFPVVGSGVATHPVLADLDGDGTREVLVAHAAGQLIAFRHDGTPAVPFDHGELVDNFSPFGPPKEEADPRWEVNLALLAQSAVADLSNDGTPEVLLPTMALPDANITDLAADPGEALASLSSVLTMWRADGRVREPFPLLLDGWTLFAGATVADLDADTLPEVLLPTDGGWLHAWNARGDAAPAFPRFTGGWTGPAGVIGDLDADGLLDVVTGTREGALFAWRTEGAACVNGESAIRWAALHHDARNTNAPGTDAVPPAAVADARIEDGRLVFTAVGDDHFAGAADHYDARWSASPIADEAAFASATAIEVTAHPRVGRTVRAGDAIPASAHVAVVAYDDAGNRSPLPAAGAAGVPPDPCASAPVIHLDGGGDGGGCACAIADPDSTHLRIEIQIVIVTLFALVFASRRRALTWVERKG